MLVHHGIEPAKAIRLVNLIAEMESSTDSRLVTDHLLSTVDALVKSGVPRYDVFAALLCHPSAHDTAQQRYRAIGAKTLKEMERTP
ncbi:hypothetical protein QI633_07850 [Nocardioides sp. QY071]|uniref:hypothetical protein n=1 Tax=Nocardioides sp. QY071 TaxID=3044187 RepID=UPI00249B5CF2|nr:hypothetical protein [Nocardioides sp. QY071]WGY03669.1 hypothetical protein QI633_07850 [Nocardioides sp. QY071]